MGNGLGKEWIAEMLDLARSAGLGDDPATLDRIRLLGQCGSRDDGQVWRDYLWSLAVSHIVEANPFYPPPTPEQLAGEGGVPFGLSPLSNRCHFLPVQEQSGGVVVLGTTGCGKTTALCHFSVGAAAQGVPVHIDVPRGDYRPLAKHFGFRLATVRTYRMNILSNIRNVPSNVLAQSLADVLAHHLDFRTRGKQATARWISEVQELFRNMGHEPCVADLVDLLKRRTFERDSYEKECAARVIERLEACVAFTAEVLVCERGQPFEELPDPVIFEMNAVEPQVRDLLAEIRIRREFLYRQFNPEARERWLNEIIDEAMNLGRERRFSSTSREVGTASMDVTVTQSRFLAMRIWFATQMVTGLSAAIRATSTLMLAGTTTADQQYETARLLGLSREQAEWLPRLPRGTFIARSATPRLPEPFLLSFPRFEALDERIGEAEAQEISERSMADLPSKPRWQRYQQPIHATPGSCGEDVVEREFQEIVERPNATCGDHARAIGIDTATESAARHELGVDGGRGLIELDGKVGNMLFFRPTAKGRAAAEEKGYKIWRGHASPTHAWLVEQCVKGLGRAGALRAVHRELSVKGRRPDGLVDVDGKCVALQVCSSAGNYQREARALLDLAEAAGVDMAVLVATHGRHAEGVRKALRSIVGDVAWERIAVLDAAQVLASSFAWQTVIG